MVTLNDALFELVDAKQVEPREAYMKAADKTGFVMMLKNRGNDVNFAEGDELKGPAKEPRNRRRPRWTCGGQRHWRQDAIAQERVGQALARSGRAV